MIPFLWRASRGHRLNPANNPYLLWRLETYSGMHADRIAPRDFWRFVWRERAELWRYLQWAARMRHAGSR